MKGGDKGRVLIVDDDPTARKVLSAILEAAGFQVLQAGSVELAMAALEDEIVDAIITDLKMPVKTGMDLFHYVQSQYPGIPVIFLTGYAKVEAAVDALKNGAFHYFVKPPDYQKLKTALALAVDQGRYNREFALLHHRYKDERAAQLILGDDPEMKRAYETIQGIKDSACSALIVGETGTGKELFARLLHFSGNRSSRPFVAVNCAAIPRDLIEAEMFGHEKGAFTGASQRRVGRIEAAAGGTLFLDEIGELDVSVQAKLLRVLQEKQFSRLGENNATEVDFRLIASTNRNLRNDIQTGSFREDLFYRLNVVTIRLPPLRKRKRDIPNLALAFLDEFCVREGKFLSLGDDVMEVLQAYAWPGNVRELRNVVEGLVVLARKRKISIDDLPAEISASDEVPDVTQGISQESIKTLQEVELGAIRKALQACNGNKSRAATLLGVSRKTLYKRLREAEL